MTTRSVDTPKSVTAKKSPPSPPPSKSATKATTKSMATSNEFETPGDKAPFFRQSKEAEEWRSINYPVLIPNLEQLTVEEVKPSADAAIMVTDSEFKTGTKLVAKRKSGRPKASP